MQEPQQTARRLKEFAALLTQDLMLICKPLYTILHAFERCAPVERMYAATLAALLVVHYDCIVDKINILQRCSNIR